VRKYISFRVSYQSISRFDLVLKAECLSKSLLAHLQAWVEQARKSLKKAIQEQVPALLKKCRHPEWVQGIPQNCASIALGHCSCQDVRALFQAVAESEAVGLEPEVLRGFGSVIQTGCDRFRNTGVESIHPAGIG